jgi:hypothetical protein
MPRAYDQGARRRILVVLPIEQEAGHP